jgi:uroporphyrin-III C-methyltransferase/precorrin-2 dehydrogenase/sirohydrochlorin ferrochelatase
MSLPLLFKNGLSCLVVGGGQVASHKIDILLRASCQITIVAPNLCDRLATRVQLGSLRWLEREYLEGDCRGFQLVIAATPIREINRQISEETQKLGIPINVVDDPVLSTVIFPAVWRDGSLMVAVSTEGEAPFMAAGIRNLLAGFARGMGQWVEMAGRFRKIVRTEISDAGEKKNLYQQFFDAGHPNKFDSPPNDTCLSHWLVWLDHIRKRRN